MGIVKYKGVLGRFKYDDTEYEICDNSNSRIILGTYLHYIGNGLNVRLPKGCNSYIYLFSDYKGTLDLSNFETVGAINMKNMFEYACIPNLDLSKFDTSKVIDMNSMFKKFVGDLDLTSFDTSSLQVGYGMFVGHEGNLKLFSTQKLSLTPNIHILLGSNYLIHTNSKSNKVVGIYKKDLAKQINRYKLLGEEVPNFYRVNNPDEPYVEALFHQNIQQGYRVYYKGKRYDISKDTGYTFNWSDILVMQLDGELLKTREEVYNKIEVLSLLEYREILDLTIKLCS